MNSPTTQPALLISQNVANEPHHTAMQTCVKTQILLQYTSRNSSTLWSNYGQERRKAFISFDCVSKALASVALSVYKDLKEIGEIEISCSRATQLRRPNHTTSNDLH